MRIIPDTNVLVRAIARDDDHQSKIAEAALSKAEVIALPILTLCELVWVLSRTHRFSSATIAEAIRRLVNSTNVLVDRPAVNAGLAMLDAGGDFADAAIALEGRWLGADTFISFDKKAVKLLTAQGELAKLLD